MDKFCKRCNKKLLPNPGKTELNPRRMFCNHTCQTRYTSLKYYHRLKNDTEYLEKQSKKMHDWYIKNKDHQYENIKKNYYKHKPRWVERKWVNRNRNKILFHISDNCHLCGKNEINIIHHETYDFPKRKIGSKPQTEEYFENYCEYILGFCSRKCHMRHHRKLNKDKLSL